MSLLPQANPKIERILAYWIRERMDIFWSRVAKEPQPYSSDPIFQHYKFTNVYRCSDRVSQYLIKEVQYNEEWSPEDLIFRTMLFKHFNLNSTWEGMLKWLGEITLEHFLKNYTYYQEALDYTAADNTVIYNNAYMTAWVKYSPKKKHYGYIQLLHEIFSSDFIKNLLACKTFLELYAIINQQPYVGDFLSYQYAIDLNYSPIWKFDESDLCFATVGSKRGIEKLLGYRPNNHAEVIRFYTRYQENLMATYGMFGSWVNLFGRRLHHIDIQNCFCELDKYTRVALPDLQAVGGQGKRIKNTFKKTPEPYPLYFPTWWDISSVNEKGYTVC